ncbi:hypothetical protein QYM36_015815 [Artemia franciscana]|uniref:Uncharacterized protein n=1 Tax=Artemia franciscana TaxID=6661 RepID=A0AA88H5V3_ARTSF|nr:hypothetical protein QYM36_015815 [Artemia franciscana]
MLVSDACLTYERYSEKNNDDDVGATGTFSLFHLQYNRTSVFSIKLKKKFEEPGQELDSSWRDEWLLHIDMARKATHKYQEDASENDSPDQKSEKISDSPKMPRVPRSQMEAHRKDAVEQRAELEEGTLQALNKVCEGHSVKKTAAMFSIPRATLHQCYNNYKNLSDDQKLSARLSGKKILQYDEESDDSFSLNDNSHESSLHPRPEENDQLEEEGVFDIIAKGDFVKVVYQGEYFPSVAQAKNHDSAKICMLSTAGINKWK